MTHRRRTLAVAAAALAATVVAATQLPQETGNRPALTPSSESGLAPGQRATAGLGQVSPEARAEIDRVLAETGATGRNARTKATAIAASRVQCADFEGQTYCLGQGWTEDTEEQVQARVSTELSRLNARQAPVESTGDLDALTQLQRRAALPPLQRERQDREELELAARSVAKVLLLRHELLGEPLPAGFLARHPEVRVQAAPTTTNARSTTTTATTASASPSAAPAVATSSPSAGSGTVTTGAKTWASYPAADSIMDPTQVREQTKYWYCGPTAMQMIAWGWRGYQQSQSHWVHRLGTTSNGTAITDMVRVVNNKTTYDDETHAGPYVVLDISDFTFKQWYRLMMRHVHDYQAPVVLHPVLLKQYYPYLDDDASGHFQVGRGYDKRGPDQPADVGYFEPWNQQRFDRSEPYIERVQWRRAYKSYRANKAHPHQNIGV